jgi:glycosyltransferase involved in cell wall biosynthesis
MRKLGILVPTYNRAASLRRTLSSLAARADRPPPAQLIVIDNNSADTTREVCGAFPGVLYVFEPRQGLSYARNAGIAALSDWQPDDVIAFIDDDVEAAPGWLSALHRAFDQCPDADAVGGRVLPVNASEFPAWLTAAHWGPLALQDHGSHPRLFSSREPIGLIGANVAFRKRVFDRIGGFSPQVQRVKDGVGSTEDHEFLVRLYHAGGKALYTPDALVVTHVPAERLTREYHRRWHLGHGRFHAVMESSELQPSPRRLPGVAAQIFRGVVTDALAWLRGVVSRDAAAAFAAETRVWFSSGYLKERCACLVRR